MRKIIRAILIVVLGLIMIPALYAMAIALFGTVLAVISNPRVMMVLLGILGIISIPGIVIGFIARH